MSLTLPSNMTNFWEITVVQQLIQCPHHHDRLDQYRGYAAEWTRCRLNPSPEVLQSQGRNIVDQDFKTFAELQTFIEEKVQSWNLSHWLTQQLILISQFQFKEPTQPSVLKDCLQDFERVWFQLEFRAHRYHFQLVYY